MFGLTKFCLAVATNFNPPTPASAFDILDQTQTVCILLLVQMIFKANLIITISWFQPLA